MTSFSTWQRQDNNGDLSYKDQIRRYVQDVTGRRIPYVDFTQEYTKPRIIHVYVCIFNGKDAHAGIGFTLWNYNKATLGNDLDLVLPKLCQRIIDFYGQ